MHGTRCDRRELLACALAAGAAGGLAAPAIALAGPPADDLAALRSALEVEQLVVFVYRTVLADGKLGGTDETVARRMLRQDEAHVQILSAALTHAGQRLPVAPGGVAEGDRRLSAMKASGLLIHVRTQDDALRLLYDVESHAIGKYYEALHTLTEPGLIRTAAAIMGADAQHASAIGGLLHPGDWVRVVPTGSVKGKR